MDKWKYYDITHRFHSYLNPMSRERIDELIKLINLNAGITILDIGCGKGEFLIRLSKNVDAKFTGVDLSPFFISEARENAKNNDSKEIKFVEMDGKKYTDEVATKFDLTICMGASWIYDGHEKTLINLIRITKLNGLIIVGEPYWKATPSEKYLQDSDVKYEDFSTHFGNVEIAETLGLRPLYAIVSNLDDWDRYEHLQWLGVDHHLLTFPDDPDNDELVKTSRKSTKAYLEEGRDVLGWAIYVFRKVE